MTSSTVECINSIKAYFGDNVFPNKARLWIESYLATDSNQILLNKFLECFEEDGALFGLSLGNVRRVAEAVAKQYYPNEAIVKSSFISKVLNKKGSTIGFEFPVGSNRVDLCSIGKKSSAYEVKTAYDSLARLNKQLQTYLRAFEFVYVVCSEDKLAEVIVSAPKEVGVYFYRNATKEPRFMLFREAQESLALDEDLQKESFPTALNGCFDINSSFKRVLKEKYRNNWDFLKSHIKEISLLDYQASFKQRVSFSS